MVELVLVLLGVSSVILILFLHPGIEIIPEEERLVVYRLGRFHRLAGPGVVFVMRRLDTIQRRLDVRNHMEELYVDGVFVYGVPIGVTLQLWVRLDPMIARANPKLLLFTDAERGSQAEVFVRDGLIRALCDIEQAQPLSADSSLVDRLLPILPGTPSCSEILRKLRADLDQRFQGVGLVLVNEKPIIITQIHPPEDIIKALSRGRVITLLRDQFPNLSDANLLQMMGAIEGTEPGETIRINMADVTDQPTSVTAAFLREGETERSLRLLERCADIEAIRQAHRSLIIGPGEDPVSAWLRSFARVSEDVESALRQSTSYNRRLALSSMENDLDRLIRELQRLADRESVRFLPIASLWRQRVAFYRRQLAEDVERRQEIDSPYITGVPLTEHQEVFVGRTDIGARIEQLLLDQRRPPLLLYGQRRMGKTSLLHNLGRLLPNSIVPLFVDLQGPATQARDHAGFLYNLARGMGDSARRQRNLELPILDRNSLTADPFTRFDEWLDEVEAMLGQDSALLLLDEFEALDQAIARGRFSEADVLGMLRHLIQHRPRFKVLLAGSHTLQELERWSGYLINVQVVHISYLKEDEARKLVEQPVADFALRYEPDASQRVLDLTRCHPFLVQLLCGEIVASKNEQEIAVRRLARLADVEAAATEALSHGSFFFADIERNQVDADSLVILRALAVQGERATMNREQLAAQLADPGRVERNLTSLIQRELIEPADGGYRFQVELIRRWFANRSR